MNYCTYTIIGCLFMGLAGCGGASDASETDVSKKPKPVPTVTVTVTPAPDPTDIPSAVTKFMDGTVDCYWAAEGLSCVVVR